MSRSGYSDYCDGWDLIRWRGAVSAAIRGKRGQAFLKEMIAALDAMPDKNLIAHELSTASGEVCAMGAVGRHRGLDMSAIDPEEPGVVAKAFGVAGALVQEIAYLNDEFRDWQRNLPDTDALRWKYMRDWCEAQITAEKVTP